MVERNFISKGTIQQPDDPLRSETILAEGVTFEQFLEDFSEMHAEWIMGKVILVVSNNTRHQLLLSFIEGLFKVFFAMKGGIGKVFLAGVPMKIDDDTPAREPDLLIVLKENFARIRENFVDGPADIAVEIVSPGSTIRDRGEKFVEFESAGVREYWLIDPIRLEATVYWRDEEGHFRALPLDSQGRFASKVLPGFAFDPALLWRDELPDALQEIELVKQMLG
jgi:Uma2 family endonuclease